MATTTLEKGKRYRDLGTGDVLEFCGGEAAVVSVEWSRINHVRVRWVDLDDCRVWWHDFACDDVVDPEAFDGDRTPGWW